MTHVNKMLYSIYSLFVSRPLLVSPPTDETPTILQHVVQHVCVFVHVVEFDTKTPKYLTCFVSSS